MIKEKEQCQIEGCSNLVKYALYHTFADGSKRWLHVCRKHEGKIGMANMRRAGGIKNEEVKAQSD